MLNIPKEIEKIINTFEEKGFKAYIVGGCVRDLLLSKRPNDYDITTNALPHQIKEIFPKTIDTGIKHGTITILTETGEMIEATTFRTEGKYEDMRRPDSVEFVTDIKEDLARRDFTVNAMAYNKTEGIIDCFGGKNDLKKQILRAVGDPYKRFSEDALRIIRLVRFASTLNFKIHRKTKKAAFELAKNLGKISAERVYTELIKTLNGNNLKPLEVLIKSGGLENFGIEYKKPIVKITRLPHNSDLRFFALLKLCECNIPLAAEKLKVSNKLKNYCTDCESILWLSKKSKDSDIKYALSLCNINILEDVCSYKTHISNCNIMNICDRAKQIIKSAEPYKISHLAISGNDLLKNGINGEEIGKKLNKLCNIVRQNPSLNTKEKLLEIIKDI